MKDCKVDISNGCLCFLCVYACLDPAGSFLPFLVSVLAHELGHFVVLWLLEIPVYSLKFGLSGAQLHTSEMSYLQEFFVALAGPLVNLCLIFSACRYTAIWTFVNLVLLIYNLLPFYPLDGGRILRSLLCMILPPNLGDFVEKICVLSCILFMLGVSCYLTFYLHSGFWPMLVCCLLLLKVREIFCNVIL